MAESPEDTRLQSPERVTWPQHPKRCDSVSYPPFHSFAFILYPEIFVCAMKSIFMFIYFKKNITDYVLFSFVFLRFLRGKKNRFYEYKKKNVPKKKRMNQREKNVEVRVFTDVAAAVRWAPEASDGRMRYLGSSNCLVPWILEVCW